MLISYPFLLGTDFKEAQDLPDVKEDEARGLFPVTTREGWHGGLHLVHTIYPDGVRAIADGTVTAYRVPTAMPPKEEEEKKKNHALGFNGWTDDGFVLMKHEKECGEGRPVVFYSLYMHLRQLTFKHAEKKSEGKIVFNPTEPTRTDPNAPLKLHRKENFATPGYINGRDKRIHIEVFTDTMSLDAFLKPEKGAKDPWGDLYFKIPNGTPFVKDPRGTSTSDGTVGEDMLLAVRYVNGARVVNWLNEETGETKMAPRSYAEVEYDLYVVANRLDGDAISRGYEVLRFGRYMDWNEVKDDPKPSTSHCWIELPTGNFVDVAKLGEKNKFTDADFPAWAWKKLEAAPLLDVGKGAWKLPDLLAELDANGDGTLIVGEAEGWLKAEENRAALRRLVVKFQSEWDGDNAEDRWGHIKKLMAKDPEAKRAALKRKLEWLEAQRAKAESGLPNLKAWVHGAESRRKFLDEVVKQAKARQTDADTKLTQAKQSLAALDKEEEKKKLSKKQLEEEKKKRKSVVASAEEALRRANLQTPFDERTVEQQKALDQRDMGRLAAAEALLAQAPGRKQALEAELKAMEGIMVNKEDEAKAEAGFKKFTEHIAALQWWTEVRGQVKDFPASTDVWHFHPLHFIEQMKKCHWLSTDDLGALYPGTEVAVREKYRTALSRCLWKYGILGKARTAHFFGQGRVESGGLQSMMELSPAIRGEVANSTSPEQAGPNGFYHDPREWYFTHERHYQHVIGNKDQANLVGKDGNPFTAWDAVIEDYKKQKVELPKERDEAEKKVKELEKALAELPKGEAKRREELMAKKREAQALLAGKKEAIKNLSDDHVKAMDQAAKDYMDVAKSTTGDAIKFRGRGMKQLTGRANYADYWRYRGWIRGAAYTNRTVDEPQKVSTVPFNCIDTGSWFFMSRPKGPITKFIKDENDVSRDAIWNVSATINGIDKKTKQPIDFQKRKDATEELFEVVGDEPLEETKMGQAALKAAEQKGRKG